MEILSSLLLWIHLVALALGGVATFGIPVVGSRIAGAPPEVRPLLFSINKGLSTVARIGLGALIVTGPLVFWLKWNFTAASMTWFGIKMVLVIILIAIVIVAGINSDRASKGDMAAVKRAPQIGIASMVVLLLVILAAVFAFN